ncbi:MULTISPECIES: LptF/LptG family permease [unclassified Campylobacter]|uniref:LptF/LptG family permease n=1 Tax=unclassified Campylobacter TaxID=2593542 RepID=UPI0012769DFF|nr:MULTISPECIES: LptF/LptG family permease [unclassified Campylobacter]EAI8624231.1 LptF/LptG family permease [Campylobacter lari]EAJ5677579.1 LptF/LptG family permease [Campylobacter lari]EAK0441249.1 LptF/LptG family permease [Campylobacter lari]EAK0444425.1 LptF/LptG family permease [Campylobacter lari]EAK0811715.1 LptF/LptG family permease [Campylobacter lari]
MSIFFRYISSLYLKSFFILFFSLTFFFVAIDFLLNFNRLPKSANLELLYIFFLTCSAASYILPLAIVLALVLCIFNMIRSNEFVSLYALGLSKNQVIFYPFLWAMFFCCVYVGLNFSAFAYADEYKSNILKRGVVDREGGEVLIKYNDKFIYIQKTSSQTLYNVKIFDVKNLDIQSTIHAKTAKFDGDSWNLNDAKATNVPQNLIVSKEGLSVEEFKNIKGLEDFSPKILERISLVESNPSYSILDALESMAIFAKQNISTNTLRTSLYSLVLTPFFAPFLMLIVYYYFPLTARFFNLALLAFVFFVCILLVWGLLFLLTRLSENEILLPELGIMLPVFILISIGSFYYFKHK